MKKKKKSPNKTDVIHVTQTVKGKKKKKKKKRYSQEKYKRYILKPSAHSRQLTVPSFSLGLTPGRKHPECLGHI